MERKITFTSDDAHKIMSDRRKNNSSNLVVDYTMFYTNHFKTHPIDILLECLKTRFENGCDKVYFSSNDIYQNSDYEPEFVTVTKYYKNSKNKFIRLFQRKKPHLINELNWDKRNFYIKICDNVMKELEIYLRKTGWNFETIHSQKDGSIDGFKVYA